MGFLLLYFIIPICLYLVRPIKSNYALIAYLFFIFTLSYDNVTDYEFFYAQFRDVRKYGSFNGNELKGLELGWQLIYSLMSFTKYGYVIIHAAVNAFVILFFMYESKQRGLLNVSVFLFFLMCTILMQDNMMRQNPAIILGILCVNIIMDRSLDKKNLIIIFILVALAYCFHFSAIVLLVWLVIIYYLRDTVFSLKVVVPLAIILAILRYSGAVVDLMNVISSALFMINTDYSSYYYMYLDNQEIHKVGMLNGFFILMSFVPLAYFLVFNPQRYRMDPWLRLSVNMAIVVMIWNNFIPIHALTRITAYMDWFLIWGCGYMINDSINSRELTRHILPLLVMLVFGVSTMKRIDYYFGDNVYMTVFSKDSKQLKTYPRTVGRDLNEMRLRN